MTGDQSRELKIGDRVCWGFTTTDLGTVVGTSWSGVTVDWDDKHASSIQHNDIAQVERVPTKIMRAWRIRLVSSFQEMNFINPKEVGTEIECPGSPRCTCRISFFHAGDRTQMTTKEGRRLKET